MDKPVLDKKTALAQIEALINDARHLVNQATKIADEAGVAFSGDITGGYGTTQYVSAKIVKEFESLDDAGKENLMDEYGLVWFEDGLWGGWMRS